MGLATHVRRGWNLWPRWLRAAMVIIGNLLIAIFLTSIGYGGSFAVNLLFSQCVGLSILSAVEITLSRLGQRHDRLQPLATPLAIVAGSLLGTALGYQLSSLLFDVTPGNQLNASGGTDVYWQIVLIGLLFGTIATAYFTLQQRLHEARGALQQQRLRTAEVQREEAQMQLRLLRAQVEPHFLFNSLAHVDSLLAEDPSQGRALLGELINYLRASLRHSRQSHCTLGEELDLLQSYLALMCQRMGGRLAVAIYVDEALRTQPMPPMLLQPLVENAIIHGLEPCPRGGRLLILGRHEGGDGAPGSGEILLEVSDNGIGLNPSSQTSGSGNGLENLRARLRGYYNGGAALELEENRGGGLTARLSLPIIAQPWALQDATSQAESAGAAPTAAAIDDHDTAIAAAGSSTDRNTNDARETATAAVETSQ